MLEIWYRDNKLGSNYISRRKFMSEGNLRRPFSEGEAKLRQEKDTCCFSLSNKKQSDFYLPD